MIHRNLKLSNIFLTMDNHIKIGDFSLIENIYDIETSIYLSPERIKEEDYDYKSDNWDLGIILYELTQLKHPFIDENNEKTLNNIKIGKYFEFVNSNYSNYLLNLKKFIKSRTK